MICSNSGKVGKSSNVLKKLIKAIDYQTANIKKIFTQL